jgi:hypothetical protein
MKNFLLMAASTVFVVSSLFFAAVFVVEVVIRHYRLRLRF